MKTVIKVMLGLILGSVVLIAGCAALLGGAANQVQKESDKTAITPAQYSSATTGVITRREVEARFGTPQTSDEVQAEGVQGIPDSDFSQACIYYNREGELASLYQFCFDGTGGGAKLQTKASY